MSSTLRTIKKINKITGYDITVTFDNGVELIIQFLPLIETIDNKVVQEQLKDLKIFSKAKVVDNTIAWRNLYWSKLENRKTDYAIDPNKLYKIGKRVECPVCKGTGRIHRSGSLFEVFHIPDFNDFIDVMCDTCGGLGVTSPQRFDK